MRKKIRKKKRHTRIENNAPYIPVSNKENISKNKFKVKLWQLVVGISVIVSIIVTYEPIRSFFLNPHEKYKEEKFIEGDLKPKPFTSDTGSYTTSEHPPVFIFNKYRKDDFPIINGIYIDGFDKMDYVHVIVGGVLYTCFKKDFYKGINIFNPFFATCVNTNLILGVHDNRLYVSAEFKDLQKEETIGFIEFNHWSLYKPNMLDFENDDERLQVKDKQNNIVFAINLKSVQPKEYAVIEINGYFINPSSILIITNETHRSPKYNFECIPKSDSDWKQKALLTIQGIKSIF